MAWTTPRTWSTGELVTAAVLNTHVRDNLNAIGNPWTAYTPSWTAATTNPSLGNGTATGAYIQAGKLVVFRARIVMGSTTTYGSGQYSISLPTTAASGMFQIILAEALVSGSAYRVTGRVTSGGSSALLYCDPTTAGNALRNVTASTPAAFGSGSELGIYGLYEAA